jgi:hypothetical protein
LLDDAEPVGEDVVPDDLAVAERDPADAAPGERSARRWHAEQRAAVDAFHLPADDDPVPFGDQIGHRRADVSDGVGDPLQVLVEALSAGCGAGLVDRVGGDDLLEDFRALLGDRLLVQSARDRPVDLDAHWLVS